MAVDDFLSALEHPRRDDIVRVRAALLEAEPALSENIKWNAPNFLLGGEDRVTLRIHPGDTFQVVLHRGVKRFAEEVRVDDPAGLVRWAGPDRGILTVPSGSVEEWLTSALPVIVAWVRA